MISCNKKIRQTAILACQQLVSYKTNCASANSPEEATNRPVKQFPSSYIKVYLIHFSTNHCPFITNFFYTNKA
jgi:hypothetical protein